MLLSNRCLPYSVQSQLHRGHTLCEKSDSRPELHVQRKWAKRSTLSPPELLFATGQTLQKAPASTARLQLGERPLRGRLKNCSSYLSLR